MSFIKNLYYKEDNFVLDVPEWEILDKGITVLSGPSGSGKTTLIRVLLGLEKKGSYSWEFKNVDLAKLPIEQKQIGVVFQTLDLFPHMTALENIEFAASARLIQKSDYELRLSAISNILQMNPFFKKNVTKISGGERQRVAIARALIANPRALILDEPFNALDSALKNEARQLLKKTVEHFNLPTILITHDAEDIQSLADKVSYIENGRLI